MSRVYNFSAGPSMLPLPVLEKAASEMTDYRGSGMSVMEMSHRTPVYEEIIHTAEANLRKLMSIPDNYKVLFLQGGATTQFSAVPLNLMNKNRKADYIVSGQFSKKAADEAARYGEVTVLASSKDRNFTYVPYVDSFSPDADYVHICHNNTIFGTAWKYVPETGGVPLVCDMSSEILSHPVDVAKFGLIYAGAQKNMAPAGLTVVILDRALAGHERAYTPLMMSYQRMIDKDSMYNTPPCYNIYMLGLVLDWLEKQGGVVGMEKRKSAKAKLLYDYLDESALFHGCAERTSRSDMNVTFRTGDAGTDAEFVKFSLERGLRNLKGHRVAGGMRASLYNAMPEEGVLRLVETMKEFEAKHHV